MLLSELRKSFFIATQRPPFTAAYRAAYDAALRLVVSRIAFRRGVAAVYLTSGLLDEPVYGLSDIDLTVIVDDERARGHLTNLLAQLRLVVPILGPIEQQAVWTRAELATRLAGSPFVQYRLLGPRPRRLLLGEDVLAPLATTAATAPRLRQALAEIRFAWELLRPVLAGERRADGNYLFRKAFADMTRATIFALWGESVASRAACLEDRRAFQHPDFLDLARAPFAHPQIAPAAAFRAVLGTVADLFRFRTELHSRQVILDGPLPAGGDAPSVWLDAAIEDRPPYATPRREVAIDELPDDADVVRWSRGAPLTVVYRGDYVFPFGAGAPWGIALRPHHPEMFGSDSCSEERHAFAARMIAERRAAIAALLDSRAIFRSDAASLRLLACAARESADERRIVVPASLEAEPPGSVPELLARLGERLGRDLGVARGPASSMAVLICTRNRAELLRSALESICAQRRPADQVVVLDNGSSDGTRAVVDGFRARLPIVYGFLAEPSIPAARNAAIRLATAEILCFIDDDAIADPGWLAGFEDTFRGDPNIGVVGGSIWPARGQRGALADFHRWMQRA